MDQGEDVGTQTAQLGEALAEGLSTERLMGVVLKIIDGPDRGLTMNLEEPSMTIGKGARCDLRLADETVSREHLRLELSPSALRVTDAGSKNGTWLGSVRIERASLTENATLRIGATTFSLELVRDAVALVVSNAVSFGGAEAASRSMRHLFAKLTLAAKSDLSVLLEGESGTGKSLLARGLHDASARRDAPFVAVDCGAIPPTLIESELFGHERGAFTGADRARSGLFEQANGGTIFLDEIGELPLELQPKLLRALQEREIRRVGGTKSIPLDIRVVSATNRNLRARSSDSSFREDLFYRLAGLRVRVPSLRERIEDVEALATTFLRDLTSDSSRELPEDVLDMFRAHTWPGNVRELRNAVHRFAVLDSRERDDLFDVPSSVRAPEGETGAEAFRLGALLELSFPEARDRVNDRFESEYVRHVMKRAGGVVSRAVELSGTSRSSFYRLLERHAPSKVRDEGDG